jgi:hypothetical protein
MEKKRGCLFSNGERLVRLRPSITIRKEGENMLFWG